MRTAAIALALAGCLSEPDRPCPAAHALDGVSSAGLDIVPTLSPDRHDLYFASDRGMRFSIYHAHRSTSDGAFETPVLLDSPEDPNNDTFDPVLSATGDRLWYVKGDGNSGGDVYEALRDDSQRGFSGDHQVFTNLGKVLHPSLTANQLFIYYAVPTAGPGTVYHDIWTASRGSTDDEFGAMEKVGLSTDTSDEFNPAISPDNAVLQYATNGYAALSGEHILRATRKAAYLDGKLIDNLGQIADENDEMGQFHADGATFVFSTSRGAGGQHLWIACE